MPKRKLTVEAIIFDSHHRILLVRQRQSNRGWELPGGKVKKKESLTAAVIRENAEETGISILPQRLLGIYYIRNENMHDFIFVCRINEPHPTPRPRPPEISHCGFFRFDQLPKPIRTFTVDRINDAMNNVTRPLPIEITREQWIC